MVQRGTITIYRSLQHLRGGKRSICAVNYAHFLYYFNMQLRFQGLRARNLTAEHPKIMLANTPFVKQPENTVICEEFY